MLKLACINIEGANHLARVTVFLQHQQPDVLCLQELRLDNLPMLMETAGAGYCAWAPMTWLPAPTYAPGILGIAIVSRWPLTESTLRPVAPSGEALPTLTEAEDGGWGNSVNVGLLAATVDKAGELYRVGTTHFTWTKHGEATPVQLAHADRLLAAAAQEPELVLCGDFNAPRGRATWAKIAGVYKDNIPEHYTSSLDPVLHRAGALPYVVDGVFTTAGYRVENVVLHEVVSDHKAVTGEVVIGD